MDHRWNGIHREELRSGLQSTERGRVERMSDFKIALREENRISIVELKGYLDAHTAPELEKALQQLMTYKKFNIIVNCRDLNYISSAGLGVFMAFIEDVRQQRGDIKLSNMSPKVYNVFDLLGFPILYEIFKDEKEAIRKFTETSI
jgi:anti-sigma B factor antagonist